MGKLSQLKGGRIEREIVNLHRKIGVAAERVPLSGGADYQGNGEDVDVYPNGLDEAPFCTQVKGIGDGRGFKGLFDALADADILFLRRDAPPGGQVPPVTVVMPWATYERLIKR